jgi:N-methylhydantoinase B
MFGCLHQALGQGSVPAEGTSCLWNLFAFGGPGRVDADPGEVSHATPFEVMSFHSGGTGARPGKDGLSATAFPSGVRNMPVEVNEAISPILVRSKEYRVDSGGAGEFRGGLGQVMEVMNLEDAPFSVGANYDRCLFPPRGRDGGGEGARGNVRTSAGRALKGKGQQTIATGDAIIIEMPGGGGLGDPMKRPVEKVLADLRAGLISAEAAGQHYGVFLKPDGTLDAAATRAR